MQKIIFSISFILLALSSQAQSGMFVGLGSNFYKSNLFNLDDSRAKEDLDYVRTFNASYGLELGYRFNSRWGISIEPQWAKNNQKYMGKTRVSTGTSGYSFTVDALVKTEYIKIPISVQKIFNEDKKVRFVLNMGAFYGRLLNYDDRATFKFDNLQQTTEIAVFNNRFEQTYPDNPNSIVYGKTLARYSYREDALGALVGFGVLAQITPRFELVAQARCDYTLTDVEYKGRIDAVPDPNVNVGNFYNSFEMRIRYGQKGGDARSGAHFFNLGISLQARYLLFNNKSSSNLNN